MPRMRIFNSLEREAFESPPVFDAAERKRFFSSSLSLENMVENLRTTTNKVCFLVAAGYFKARRKFFARQFRQTDLEYVARQMGLTPVDVRLEAYSKVTYIRHQRVILDYFGCGPFDERARVFTTTAIADLVRVQFRPKLVLLEIIQILVRKKIALPSYNVLADLIIAELNRYQGTLSEVVANGLGKTQRAKLDALLEKEAFSGNDEGVVDALANCIADRHPGLSGFTRTNLFRMRKFYETYRGDTKVAPLVPLLPWIHNLLQATAQAPEGRLELA